jgi:RimJ/RimL family protein N-acetyltransferase
MTAPVIKTERLVLRPHRMDDFAPMAAFLGSEASRFVGGPYDAVRAWQAFAADVGGWDLLGFGGWAAEEKATGAFVGHLSLN